jgi:glycyl-tRNA synthetase alpha subunit
MVYTVWIDGRQVNQWSFPSGLGSVAFKDIAVELL